MLNALALAALALGAALAGNPGPRLWVALGLCAANVLALALLSTWRADQVGVSPAAAFFAVLLLASLGPVALLPVAYLAWRGETGAERERPAWPGSLLWFLVFAGLPWLAFAALMPG